MSKKYIECLLNTMKRKYKHDPRFKKDVKERGIINCQPVCGYDADNCPILLRLCVRCTNYERCDCKHKKVK